MTEKEAAKVTRKAQPAAKDKGEGIHIIVFKLGDEEYGVHITQVKEVTPTPIIYKMPKAPSFIKGVANIRGDILAIMDLEERFGIAGPSIKPKDQPGGYTLVLETNDYLLGFAVREVPETLRLPASKIDKTPDILKEADISKKYIEGIGKLDERIIIILNLHNILSRQEIKQLAS